MGIKVWWGLGGGRGQGVGVKGVNGGQGGEWGSSSGSLRVGGGQGGGGDLGIGEGQGWWGQGVVRVKGWNGIVTKVHKTLPGWWG